MNNLLCEVLSRYWSQNKPSYDVDFLIHRENGVFLLKLSLMPYYRQVFEEIQRTFPEKVQFHVRFSLDNLKLDDDVLNIPLFMQDQTDRLIGLAFWSWRRETPNIERTQVKWQRKK